MTDNREFELCSIADVLNTELRVNGPPEVEQYKSGTIRKGIRKLSDYFNAKISRRDEKIAVLEVRIADQAKALAFFKAVIEAQMRKMTAKNETTQLAMDAMRKAEKERDEALAREKAL